MVRLGKGLVRLVLYRLGILVFREKVTCVTLQQTLSSTSPGTSSLGKV